MYENVTGFYTTYRGSNARLLLLPSAPYMLRATTTSTPVPIGKKEEKPKSGLDALEKKIWLLRGIELRRPRSLVSILSVLT